MDRSFELARIGGHELVGLAEAELGGVVSPTEWVVEGGLVGAQVHQELPRPLIFQYQPLPASNRGEAATRLSVEQFE